MIPLALHTFRECFRRPFPYAVFAAVLALTLASKLFLAFTFGAEDVETVNLAVSAVFLTGFALAAFQGTALVRGDIERGTLGLLLSKPVPIGAYLCGRLTGLFAASATLCMTMAWAVAGLLLLLPAGGREPPLGAELLLAWGRALLPVLVLDAAALAISAVAPRVVGPIALVAIFLAGSLTAGTAAGLLLPDFGVFGLEAGASPPLGLLSAYAAVFSSAFLLVAYIFLASKSSPRSQS